MKRALRWTYSDGPNHDQFLEIHVGGVVGHILIINSDSNPYNHILEVKLMNLETLEKLVILGEFQQLEFKMSTGQRSDGAKAVCACMLNGKGGYVLFGVTDKGEIRGQDISANTLKNIARELRKIDSPIFPDCARCGRWKWLI